MGTLEIEDEVAPERPGVLAHELGRIDAEPLRGVTANTDRTVSRTAPRLGAMTAVHAIEKIPYIWCRMWSEEAGLTHDVLTDDSRQWSGKLPGLDAVVGPGSTEEFAVRYQRNVGNRFAPRTLVVDGDRALAYTWDVTRRDGTVLTGADVNILRDGRVAENWTIPAAVRDDRTDLIGAGTASRDDLAALCRAEAAARGVVIHRDPVVDEVRRTAAYLWATGTGPDASGGIEVLVVRHGRVASTWSVPGSRAFRY